METKATRESRVGLLGGRSPLLRLQSDEKLIALIRSGNEAAFEQLFDRYRARLMAFCRHMLGSKEDAEDVMQEVFVNAYNAIRADEREINARPWLYRIARNRCLNFLRKPAPDGQDTMDEFVGAHGVSTADIAHKRADLRHLLEDVQKLPETQRTALLLREIDVLAYDQIAEAMDTTVSSVKSLLVRARMSLAEASEARALSCDDVRLQLAEVAEGLKKTNPALKRHVRECEDCRAYKKMLGKTNTQMAMALSVGPLMVVKKLLAAKLAFLTGGTHAGSSAAATGTAAAAGGAAATSAGGAASVGISAAVAKGAVTLAVTALVAGGAVEANKAVHKKRDAGKAAFTHTAPASAGSTGGTSEKQAETAKGNQNAEESDSTTQAAETPAETTDESAGSETNTSDDETGSGGTKTTPSTGTSPTKPVSPTTGSGGGSDQTQNGGDVSPVPSGGGGSLPSSGGPKTINP